MTPDLRVWIAGRPPTPNNRHGNPWAEAKVLAQWRTDARNLASDAATRAGWTMPDLARLTITFVLPDHRARDLDNLVASTKPLTDGLVDARVIKGDSLADLVGIAYQWRYERGIAGTLYVVTAVRPDQVGLQL